ncbi:unnamed protein product [Musa acuminata subsp. malaccensis]|uniref:(wild Malaysian banana) hypothetical protein n=1 Tax=Musa acuminata subsp. malaccensis TaxID=214687 RepID=A0A8D7F4G4_MUSAM|nr:unnamed protein product [Musa acuminata subsp. malaccensis]
MKLEREVAPFCLPAELGTWPETSTAEMIGKQGSGEGCDSIPPTLEEYCPQFLSTSW